MKDLTTQSHEPHITNNSFPVRQGYKWTKVGVIPEDWKIQRLDAFCSVYSGGTPSTARHDFYGGHIPWITSGDLNAQRITEVSNYLTQAGFDSSAAKMIESGDLVIALYGATAGVVAVTEIEAAINQAVLAIKTNRCDSEYLFHHLASRKNQIVATYTQGGQPNLSGEIIRSLVIIIPPLSEQRAIAEVLSDVDGLLNALEALIAKKHAIKQATMQQLLTGKTRLPGFSRKWQEMRIGDLFDAKAGGDLVQSRYNDVQDNRYPYPIYANGLERRGLYGFSDYAEEPADAITVTARGTLGQAFYRDTPFVAIGRLLVLKPKFSLDARFFCEYINYGIHFAVESTGVPQLTAPQISRYQLPVPTEPEQHAIASVLLDMDAEVTALEQRRDKTHAIKQGMMQQLLTGRVRLSESRIIVDDTDDAD